MKKHTPLLILAAALIGCASQKQTATMRVVSEIRPISQVGVSGDKIVQVTGLVSNSWNVQEWKQNGKTVTYRWPIFDSQIVALQTNVLGNAPAPMTNTVIVLKTNPPVEKATLELLPSEKVEKARDAE